jgi:hypothetical protein
MREKKKQNKKLTVISLSPVRPFNHKASHPHIFAIADSLKNLWYLRDDDIFFWVEKKRQLVFFSLSKGDVLFCVHQKRIALKKKKKRRIDYYGSNLFVLYTIKK